MKAPDFFTAKPPQELITALKEGRCILFAGSSLSEIAGYPSWNELIKQLIQWNLAKGIIDPALKDSLAKSIEMGESDYLADSIASQVKNANRQDDLEKYLDSLYPKAGHPLTQYHRLLGRLPFTLAITPNFDDLLERTFARRQMAIPYSIFTTLDAASDTPYFEAMRKAQEKHDFYFLKLRGWFRRPGSVILSSIQYKDFVETYYIFNEFLSNFFHSHTLFFFGISLDEILRFVEPLKIGGMKEGHYALISPSEVGWESKADRLLRRYGIRSMISPDSDFASSRSNVPLNPYILDFLNSLIAEAGVTPGEEAAKPTPQPASRLRKVSLKNIGPFEQLELNLDDHWNILLGDNGVGKSSVIRAIAACLLGRDAENYMNRIMRFNLGNANITLETDRGKPYGIDLSRSGQTVNLTVRGGSLLEIEKWLVIGFPPARTVTWNAVKIQVNRIRNRTTPEDLLPLLSGESDPRLDSVKQWFMDVDYQIKSSPDSNYVELRKRMIDIINKVTVGLKMEFSRVDMKRGTVYFKTDDGEVPVDAVSQGTASLIGWVGYLTQRLFEVYPNRDPHDVYALVIIDEIDAHMHPEWQQSLVGNLRDLFPNVQFIATTHSPMVVSGMPVKQIIRFDRNSDGRILQLPLESDITLGRADQLLTSDLFDLNTTLDPTTQGKIDLYYELRDKQRRTAEEEDELQQLQRWFRFELPMPQQIPSAKRAQELVNLLLAENLEDNYMEVQNMVRDKARQLLEEVDKKRKVQK
jgi:predicted ATP-binding protein involved in virulence